MRRVLAPFALVVAIVLTALTAAPADASAPPTTTPDTSTVVPVRSGDVTIVEGDRVDRVLMGGGSATVFNLRLPDEARCPGDSQHDDWRVQTFIVPADVDPGTLQYTVIGPSGTHQYAVYDKYTQPIVDQNLIANEAAGSPAFIDTFFPMSFAVFPPGEIPAGNYRIGVACTWFGATADYWDTELVITESPGDQPAQLTWHLAGTNAGSSDGGDRSSSWLVPVVVVVVAVAVIGVGLRLRRNRSAANSPRS